MSPGDILVHTVTGLTVTYVERFYWAPNTHHIVRKPNGRLMLVPAVIVASFWELVP